ncbi:uncharacterized protein LOC117340081 [Pecten maximus]|uniref:uncharacterized protein LOC117340081 n=1 Tax=Pecten maximus TaxID=6579 RepID=UPI001457E5C4|nr:uncharacterized protein LOC117340081 [Pecten maximus]
MEAIYLLVLFSAISMSHGILFKSPNWYTLQVRWSPNLIGSNTFISMPRTRAMALSQGYSKVSDCGDIPGINGERFVKEGDYSVVLLYDINGYIAGIQIGFPHNDSAQFPPDNQINHPFLRVGDMYLLTAYFTDPAAICTRGRRLGQFLVEGTGDALYIQNGTDPVANSMKIPMTETELESTKWTKGPCFRTMGVHYWYDLTTDMSCDDYFPVFLLYNRGRLNAFGWAIGMNIYTESGKVEHPSKETYKYFIDPVPDCLYEGSQVMTQHIYMTLPLLNILC